MAGLERVRRSSAAQLGGDHGALAASVKTAKRTESLQETATRLCPRFMFQCGQKRGCRILRAGEQWFPQDRSQVHASRG
jgi:hypothetical protein